MSLKVLDCIVYMYCTFTMKLLNNKVNFDENKEQNPKQPSMKVIILCSSLTEWSISTVSFFVVCVISDIVQKYTQSCQPVYIWIWSYFNTLFIIQRYF